MVVAKSGGSSDRRSTTNCSKLSVARLECGHRQVHDGNLNLIGELTIMTILTISCEMRR
jgi:hypothetical protein